MESFIKLTPRLEKFQDISGHQTRGYIVKVVKTVSFSGLRGTLPAMLMKIGKALNCTRSDRRISTAVKVENLRRVKRGLFRIEKKVQSGEKSEAM